MSHLEAAREIVRAELARGRPIADARRSLELIVESSIRISRKDGEIAVLDDRGEPRLPVRDGAATFTVADLIDELRSRHPTLFEAPEEASEKAPEARAKAGERAGPLEAAADAAPRMQAADAPITLPPVHSLVPVETRAAAPAAVPVEARSDPAPANTERDWLRLTADEERAATDPPHRDGASDIGASNAWGKGWDRLATRFAPILGAAASRFRDQAAAFRAGSPVAVPAAGPIETASPEAMRAPAAPALPVPSRVAASPVWRARAGMAAAAVAVALALGGTLGFWLTPPSSTVVATSATSAVVAAKTPDPPSTGSVPPAQSPADRALKGVPEVIDTATLLLKGKVVPLFGVQWARGAGEPADLTSYLRGREVICQPSANEANAFRCEVEGQDLSKVILYNGGGKTTSTATPDLQAAEAHARTTRVGLWSK